MRPSWVTYCGRLPVLCRGEAQEIRSWLREPGMSWMWFCCGVTLMASALYGASVGWWQAPMQSAYAAVKFPALIFATTFGNAVLNGMLAQVLGLPVTFRESLLAILMSFVIATLVLAAFAPMSWFLAYSAPGPGSAGADRAYSAILLTHVAVIAYAGVAANVRLFRLLRVLNGGDRPSRRVLLAWLAGNLLVGTQVSWIISPFIGSPVKPLMFIQEHPFQRNFFEYAFERVVHLYQPTTRRGEHHER